MPNVPSSVTPFIRNTQNRKIHRNKRFVFARALEGSGGMGRDSLAEAGVPVSVMKMVWTWSVATAAKHGECSRSCKMPCLKEVSGVTFVLQELTSVK